MHAWHVLTRLGEAQILLPAALLAALALQRRAQARSGALWWLALLGVAIVVTTASKVAFIGWGIGWPELDFTGVSGHAMFAAAVYPFLLGLFGAGGPRSMRLLALFAGGALALLVGASRVVVGAHSVSEVTAGLLLGGAVSAAACVFARPPQQALGWAAPVVLAAWLAWMPVHAPTSPTHSMVTRLSLRLSGHARPYTRSDMRREWRLRHGDGTSAGRPAPQPSMAVMLATPPRPPHSSRPPNAADDAPTRFQMQHGQSAGDTRIRYRGADDAVRHIEPLKGPGLA